MLPAGACDFRCVVFSQSDVVMMVGGWCAHSIKVVQVVKNGMERVRKEGHFKCGATVNCDITFYHASVARVLSEMRKTPEIQRSRFGAVALIQGGGNARVNLM